MQTAAFVSLVAGLVTSTAGVVIQHAALFRIGWTFWLVGLVAFFSNVFRLALALRTLLRS